MPPRKSTQGAGRTLAAGEGLQCKRRSFTLASISAPACYAVDCKVRWPGLTKSEEKKEIDRARLWPQTAQTGKSGEDV